MLPESNHGTDLHPENEVINQLLTAISLMYAHCLGKLAHMCKSELAPCQCFES